MTNNQPGLFHRIKNALHDAWRRSLCASPKAACITLLLTFLAGIVMWGGFNWAMELTNTEAFCISCHEIRDNVYREYKHTIHYTNRTGVRAVCPDCHVPRDWTHKVIRKITATNELFQHFRRTIDTRDKFLKRRPYLARAVWRSMRRSDSRECRNCHSFDYMDKGRQNARAGEIHLEATKKGWTCMDCHIGIAHELPEELLNTEHERFKQKQIPCSYCHTDMPEVKDEDWGWD